MKNNVQGNRSVLEKKRKLEEEKGGIERGWVLLYCVLCLLAADTTSMFATMERLLFLYM